MDVKFGKGLRGEKKMFGEIRGNKYIHSSDRTASDGIRAQEPQFPCAVIKQLYGSVRLRLSLLVV